MINFALTLDIEGLCNWLTEIRLQVNCSTVTFKMCEKDSKENLDDKNKQKWSILRDLLQLLSVLKADYQEQNWLQRY